MPHSRFFSDEPLFINKEIILTDSEFRHLGVLRKQIDQLIQIVNGKNQLGIAKLIRFTNKSATALIVEVIEDKPYQPPLILAQAMIRPPKLDLVFEKCTELGVQEFILFKADLSELDDLSKNREQRIDSILISAIKQCGRLDLPKISFIDNPEKFKEHDYEYLYGDLNCDNHLDLNSLKKSKKPICFFVGPEKGFSENELSFFKDELKAAPVKINKNILRAETASIAVISILSQLHLS